MKRTLIVAVTALSAVTATAQASDLDERILAMAFLQWGYINCPAGTVPDEIFPMTNAVISEVEPQELKRYWAQVRAEVTDGEGGTELGCKAIALLASE